MDDRHYTSDIFIMTQATAKPGKEQEIQQALCDVAEAARAQSGCIDYRIFRSIEDATITVNFERWSSAAKRDIFNAGPDVEKFANAVSNGFATPPQPVSYQEIG